MTSSNLILKRIIAAFIEIILLPAFAIYLLLTIPEASFDPNMAYWQGAYFLFVQFVWGVILFYILFKDAFFHGQSIMKKVLGLRVIELHSTIKCRWWQSLLRNVIFIIPIIYIIEFFMLFFSQKGRRFGDLLARTVVIDAKESYLPKPKSHKKIKEITLKLITWILAGILIIILFYWAYFYFGAGRISEKIKVSTDTVVTIYTYDKYNKLIGYASGFFVNSEGIIVTNQHVLEGAYKAVAVYRQNEYFDIDKVIANDTTRDIVLLKVRAVDTPFVKLGNSDRIEIGNAIYTIGSPKGLGSTVSKGIISQIRFSNGVKLIQIDASISPGSSGGPLLNEKIEIIGINVAYLKEGQNLNFAIPINYVKALMNKANIKQK